MSLTEYGHITLTEYVQLEMQRNLEQEAEWRYIGFLIKQNATLSVAPHVKKGTNLDKLFTLPFEKDKVPKAKKIEQAKELLQMTNNFINGSEERRKRNRHSHNRQDGQA